MAICGQPFKCKSVPKRDMQIIDTGRTQDASQGRSSGLHQGSSQRQIAQLLWRCIKGSRNKVVYGRQQLLIGALQDALVTNEPRSQSSCQDALNLRCGQH